MTSPLLFRRLTGVSPLKKPSGTATVGHPPTLALVSIHGVTMKSQLHRSRSSGICFPMRQRRSNEARNSGLRTLYLRPVRSAATNSSIPHRSTSSSGVFLVCLITSARFRSRNESFRNSASTLAMSSLRISQRLVPTLVRGCLTIAK